MVGVPNGCTKGGCFHDCSREPLMKNLVSNSDTIAHKVSVEKFLQKCGPHEHLDDDTFICCPVPPDAHLAGIFVGDRLQRLEHLSRTNVHLAMLCLVYIGVNLTCLIVNSMDAEFREKHDLQFHLTEFWATFAFSLVGIYALVLSPRSFASMIDRPLALKLVIFIDVVATLTPAALVTISLREFEVISHEMEYASEVTMAFFDLVLVSVLTTPSNTKTQPGSSVGICILALLVALLQLGIYNFLDGPSGGPGEQIAHYFEFCFEMFSATITFLFCMDNKFNCDRSLNKLLQMQHLRRGADP